MRALLLCIMLALVAQPLATKPLAAQRSSPAPIKFGKWALLAGAIGLNFAASREHERADSVFGDLTARCVPDPTLCDVGDDGSYLDAESEFLYQTSLAYDRRARNFLFGGQGALLGAAVLFVWEFSRPKDDPENIPFEPTVNFLPHSTEIGVRVAW
ncbi:MAG TPA: hypothetical protein VFS94_07595 [Gemmatimonadales bacterium]|nr:hypothetical protein [Gemmatimonadales bacterium]